MRDAVMLTIVILAIIGVILALTPHLIPAI